jgi:hypothetical protein
MQWPLTFQSHGSFSQSEQLVSCYGSNSKPSPLPTMPSPFKKTTLRIHTIGSRLVIKKRPLAQNTYVQEPSANISTRRITFGLTVGEQKEFLSGPERRDPDLLQVLQSIIRQIFIPEFWTKSAIIQRNRFDNYG